MGCPKYTSTWPTVVDIASLRLAELSVAVDHICSATAYPGVFPGTSREVDRSIPTLLVGRMFLITKCESQLISCRVCPHAIAALGLAYAIRVVRCAPTVPCHVIEKPIGEREASLVDGNQ